MDENIEEKIGEREEALIDGLNSGIDEVVENLSGKLPEGEVKIIKHDLLKELEELDESYRNDVLETYKNKLEGNTKRQLGLLKEMAKEWSGKSEEPESMDQSNVFMESLQTYFREEGEAPSIGSFKESEYWVGNEKMFYEARDKLSEENEIFILQVGKNKKMIPKDYSRESLSEIERYKMDAAEEYPKRDVEEATVLRFIKENKEFESQEKFIESARERGLRGNYRKFHSILNNLQEDGLISREKHKNAERIKYEGK